MNSIHDMGGMDGLGPVTAEHNEPVFHSQWEGRVFAIVNLLAGTGRFNVDEFRHSLERIPGARYLNSSYYERWLDGIQTLLIEKGMVTREELESRGAGPVQEPPARFEDFSRGKGRRPRARFKEGDRVVARNINPPGHTRLPRYARGKRGVIRRDRGVYVFADSNAHGAGERAQHVYSVAFDARELWGRNPPRRERVLIDLWEDYLEPDPQAAPSVRKRTGAANAKKGAQRR